MLLRLTETHCLRPNQPLYKWAVKECKHHAKLYNRANYIKRQAFTEHLENLDELYLEKVREGKFISQNDIIRVMMKTHDELFYGSTKKNSSQQTIIRLESDWRNWFRALAEYKKNPLKFNGRPRIVGYYKEDELAPVYYTYCDAKIKNGEIYIQFKKGKTLEIKLPFHTNLKDFQQIHLVPKQGRIDVEIIYNIDIQPLNLDKTKAIGIDLGINNLAAITSNVVPISNIVNGRPVKSINQFYNKRLAEIKSKLSEDELITSKALERLNFKREMKIKDYFHKASRRIVDLMIEHNIGTCFIGHNTGWKQETNMGKRNNQNFVSIPFNKFISMLKYKIEMIGGDVIELNESYTSKCSFLDNEEICKHEKYIGKRKKRGMFQATNNRQLNADINGSLNIIKRGIGYSFNPNKCIFNPTKIDIEKKRLISNIDRRGISGDVSIGSNRTDTK